MPDSTPQEPQTPPTPTDDPNLHPEPPQEPTEPPADREAAKYRRQLRDTEKERDTLRARVDVMHRNEVARLAGSERLPIHNSVDLFEIGGVDLADLRNDDGDVDPSKVTAALAAFRTARPYLFKADSKTSFGQGQREAISTPMSWGEAFKASR